MRAPQLVRGFETSTQWLNLLGSILTLQWFSSESPASSDFSNILYTLLLDTVHYGPQTDIYTSQRPTNTLIHLCTHKQLWPHPDALYQRVLDEPCLYETDRPLPASQTLSRTLRAEQRREKAAISAVKNVSFTCWKGFVSLMTCGVASDCSNQEWSLYLLHTCKAPLLTLNWLFRERLIFSVSKMTTLRLWTVKHLLLCTQKLSLNTWRNIRALGYLQKGATLFFLIFFHLLEQ